MAPPEERDSAEEVGDAIAVIYGSQTGTAEEVAWDLVRQGRRAGFPCADPCSLDELGLAELCSLRLAVFVVATTGQGDPPGNMRKTWEKLLNANLPKDFLEKLDFAVFGLGDSHYREFNYAARKLHARLQNLGAAPILRLGLGDDQHDFGFEQELDPWAEALWDELARRCQGRLGASGGEGGVAGQEVEESRYEVEELGEASSDDVDAPRGSLPLPPASAGDFEAAVLANRSLCSEVHAQEEQDVRNIRLAVAGASYEAGDVCVVWPRLEASLVRRFVVETLGRGLGERVLVRPRQGRLGGAPRVGGGAGSTSIFPEVPLSLEEIFSSYVDISAVPPRHFFHVLSLYTEDEVHKRKLREFASRTLEAKDALYEYCKRERRSAAEVMWDFWTARPPLAALLGALPPMRPRRYSIASCPRWHDACPTSSAAARFLLDYRAACGPAWGLRLQGGAVEVACRERMEHLCRDTKTENCILDLCVAVVAFKTRTGREGKGLCSGFLQRSTPGAVLRCGFERGSLAHPALNLPMILICPGTGLSPCRALIQERHLQIASCGGVQSAAGGRFRAGLKDLMFLGFRHQVGDFLYEGEWSVYSQWLDVHIAFSRDHEDKKVYVQDLVEEQGEHVCRLLDAGAGIFVCGRSHPMPSQVFDSLVEVLQTHRGLSLEAAAARLRDMQRVKRYICDTWG